MAGVTESVVEQAAIAWFESVGWSVRHGAEIVPGELAAERSDYGQVTLEQRLRDALGRLNRGLPAAALDDAFRKLTRPEGAELSTRNRAVHRLLVDGVTVEYRTPDGEIRGAQARVLDFDNTDANDWLAVNQFTVAENKHSRRPDVVLFVNGLPLTAGREWFKPWRTISGERLADAHLPELQVVSEGVLGPRRFLDLVRDFIVFEDEGGGRLVKKMAGYHQFHAVRVAVSETLRAAELQREAERVAEAAGVYETGRRPGGKPGDQRIGVVWHSQGSGKSLTMAFYAGCIIREPEMENPTVVVLTDRNDLDDQLFGTFSRCRDLLRQPPVQAESRAHLRELLQVAAGGVVFTTIHKFFPEDKGDRHPTLSERRNIVVIADEAHRS
jgi:type I restriction enzyme R subunit